MDCHVLLIETGGNQRFIFETNKLAEAVGASELIHLTTAKTALARFLERAGEGTTLSRGEARLESDGAEVLVASAGKLLGLVRDRAVGERIIFEATCDALRNAPGLEVYGALSDPFDWDEAGALHAAIEEVHRRGHLNRQGLTHSLTRFERLPIVDDCASSGWPAAYFTEERKESAARSHAVLAKHRAANRPSARRAVRAVIGEDPARSIGELEDAFAKGSEGDEAWIAVIHADGNGFGKVFVNFDSAVEAGASNRTYADTYRGFSEALDEVAHDTLKAAIAQTWPRDEDESPERERSVTPIVPLVIGGDDLTVICEGAKAQSFVVNWLNEFDALTAAHQTISECFGRVAGPDARLSAAAGIAYTKPHFPFSIGYALAEALTASAKETKQRKLHVSSLDFHVLYDSVATDLESIRSKLQSPDGVPLWGGPWLLMAPEDMPSADDADKPRGDWGWAATRSHVRLSEAVGALNREDDDGRRVLASSKVAELRAALFGPREPLDALTKQLRDRYGDAIVPLLDAGTKQAFGNTQDPNSVVLDAITLAALERDAITT